MKKRIAFCMMVLLHIGWGQDVRMNNPQQTSEETMSHYNHLVSYYTRNDLDSLRIISYDYLVLCNEDGFVPGIYMVKKGLGGYYIRKGEEQKGIKLLKEAYHYFLKEKDFAVMADLANDIGNGYQYMGEYQTSIDWYVSSLENEALSNDTIEEHFADVNIAQTYLVLKKIDSAYYFANRYRDDVLKLNKSEEIANAYAVLGKIAMEEGDINGVIHCFEKGAWFAKKANSNVQLSHAYTNLGIAFFYKDQLSESLDYFTQALTLRKKVGNPSLICDAYLNMGEIYLALDSLKSAESFYWKGVKYAERKHRYANQKELIDALKFMYEGNHKKQQSLDSLYEVAEVNLKSFKQKGLELDQKIDEELSLAKGVLSGVEAIRMNNFKPTWWFYIVTALVLIGSFVFIMVRKIN